MKFILKIKNIQKEEKAQMFFSLMDENINPIDKTYSSSFSTKKEFFNYLNFKYGYINKINELDLIIHYDNNDNTLFELQKEDFHQSGFQKLLLSSFEIDNNFIQTNNLNDFHSINHNYSQLLTNIDYKNKKTSILINSFNDGKIIKSKGLILNTSLNLNSNDFFRLRNFIKKNQPVENTTVFYSKNEKDSYFSNIALNEIKSINQNVKLLNIKPYTIEKTPFEMFVHNKFNLFLNNFEDHVINNIKNINLVFTDGSLNNKLNVFGSTFLFKTPDKMIIKTIVGKSTKIHEEIAFLESLEYGIKNDLFKNKTFYICDSDNLNNIFFALKEKNEKPFSSNGLLLKFKEIYKLINENKDILKNIQIHTIKSHLKVDNIFQYGNYIVDFISANSNNIDINNNSFVLNNGKKILELDSNITNQNFESFLTKRKILKTKKRIDELFKTLHLKDINKLDDKSSILIYRFRINKNNVVFAYNSYLKESIFIQKESEKNIKKLSDFISSSFKEKTIFVSNLNLLEMNEYFKSHNDILKLLQEKEVRNYSLIDISNTENLKQVNFYTMINQYIKSYFGKNKCLTSESYRYKFQYLELKNEKTINKPILSISDFTVINAHDYLLSRNDQKKYLSEKKDLESDVSILVNKKNHFNSLKK